MKGKTGNYGVIGSSGQNTGITSCINLDNFVTDYQNDQEFLKKGHHVLLEVEVINGDLVCPETGRKFPVNDGIPNMLLNEDEI